MNLFSLLNKEDYLMIKWQICYAIIGVLLATGIFLGMNYLEDESSTALRVAQAEFNSARSRVELIEEEEATIIEYIGRYQTLDNAGVVRDEDRLQMLEKVADIQSDNYLFTVTHTLNKQNSMPLQYAPDVREPGEPIELRSSILELRLNLLHEDDLFRLLDGILSSPGLFQTKECLIELENPDQTSFLTLSRHFTASCEILWYTFDLDPPVRDPYGY